MPTNFSPFFERMNGIEPSSPAWKAGARTVVLHPRIGKVAAPIGCYVRVTGAVGGVAPCCYLAMLSPLSDSNQRPVHYK